MPTSPWKLLPGFPVRKTLALDYSPREWQQECHAAMRRFTVLALHRRAGKTELAIMQLLDRAMKCTLPLGQFFYVAPYLKQAKTIAWARLKQKLIPLLTHGAVEVNESELSVRFKHNGTTIRIFGGDNPDAMRGVRLDGVVMDEVAQIKPEVWQDIVQPALSDRKGWSLFIGTPSGVNMFSELFFRAQQLDDWHSARYTVYDTDALDKDEVARLKRDMSETSFAREYLCDFTAAGDDQLISLADVELAAKRQIPEADAAYSPRILGVDPARFGDDRQVIFPRQGLAALEPIVTRGLSLTDFGGVVIRKIQDFKPDAVFIDGGGVGAGVIDYLRNLGYDVIEVQFGGKPTDGKYLNKRAQMWGDMADWIRAGGAIPDRVDLKQDLAAPIYWFDSLGRMQLEPKEDLKKRGMPSPDLGDALALTFAQPVASRELEHILRGAGHRQTREYDPFAMLHK
jgi:hypothetical protein